MAIQTSAVLALPTPEYFRDQFVAQYQAKLDTYGESECDLPEGFSFKVVHDDEALDPFEDWDVFCGDAGIDLSNHRDWKGGEYGEAAPVNVPEFLEWRDRGKDYEESYTGQKWEFLQFHKNYHWLPVYLYDHSGRTVRTSSFDDRWDSGCAGIVFVRKSAFIAAGYVKKSDKAERRESEANEVMKCWVKTLDDVMTGNVYGFELRDRDDDVVDSCWGFFGDPKESGVISDGLYNAYHFIQEAREAAREELLELLAEAKRVQTVEAFGAAFVTCPHCNNQVELPTREYRGQAFPCPICSQTLEISQAAQLVLA